MTAEDQKVPEVHDLLNAHTARIAWPDLVRHFARGVLVCASPGADLLQLATTLVRDDAAEFQAQVDAGRIWRAQDDDARRWNESQPEFWAVVVAPWVVIQEIEEE